MPDMYAKIYLHTTKKGRIEIMSKLLHPHSPFRIFVVSIALTIIILVGVAVGMGPAALMTALILMLIELTFSFDNAIVNARILQHMTPFWRTMFLTIGILIAVFGMRIIFPILLVMITAGMDMKTVLDLAFNDPRTYADILTKAHPLIASFGGMFLMMLGLDFFFEKREVHWLHAVEARLQRIGKWWLPTVVALLIIVVIGLIPENHHPRETITAGVLGIITYLTVHGLSKLFMKPPGSSGKKTAANLHAAGFMSFLYLEVLDASFSFDGVIGAFAITQNVILIAVGLGIGALWVRSLTMYMVRRGTLNTYSYLEHGAHYTVLMLSLVLLGGIFTHIPEWIPGVAGLSIIVTSIIASQRARKV